MIDPDEEEDDEFESDNEYPDDKFGEGCDNPPIEESAGEANRYSQP